MVGLGSSPCRAPSPSPPTVTFFCASGASQCVFWVRRCGTASGTRNYKLRTVSLAASTRRSAAFSCAPHRGLTLASPTARRAAGRILAAAALAARCAAACSPSSRPTVGRWSVLSQPPRLLRSHEVLQRLRRVFWPSCCSSAANQLGSVPTSKPPCGGRSAPCKRQSEHPQKECQLPKKKRSPLAAGRGIEFRKCLKVSARTTCGQTAFDDVPVESDAT